ncbi:UNKNOWN [Stylonychia lemnae]|uniref:Uncharacterized protein n=1 Tax=Stylonychia lemnae TaxID=5949 RepID=A0A078AYY8_STYLE|nr:UNKNOWN [Stylonychia lemnae]|eukprot:CDW87660.1 UNKNOWN [Stylonychia lemnae]
MRKLAIIRKQIDEQVEDIHQRRLAEDPEIMFAHIASFDKIEQQRAHLKHLQETRKQINMFKGPFQKVIKNMLITKPLKQQRAKRNNSLLQNLLEKPSTSQSNAIQETKKQFEDLSMPVKAVIPQITTVKIADDLKLRIPQNFDLLYQNAGQNGKGPSKIMMEQEEYEKMSFIEKKLGTGNSYKQEALLMLVNHIG